MEVRVASVGFVRSGAPIIRWRELLPETAMWVAECVASGAGQACTLLDSEAWLSRAFHTALAVAR